MIDYKKLSNAIDYYKEKGYTYKDLPWTASEKATNITLPVELEAMKCQVGLLVGSSEQAFFDAVMDEKLVGKFVSCTPCFRYEPVVNELHHYFFMKVELFVNDIVNNESLGCVIDDAFRFYSSYLPVKVIETKEGYDIVDKKNKIELGSYGIRKHKLIGNSIYGTGLALPRLDYVLDK